MIICHLRHLNNKFSNIIDQKLVKEFLMLFSLNKMVNLLDKDILYAIMYRQLKNLLNMKDKIFKVDL